MELSEGIARRFVADAIGDKDPFAGISEPSPAAEALLPEVQNAIRAAKESADSAIAVAQLINRLLKLSEGKSTKGLWHPAAVDSLRSALLFASAGLDTSLKTLVKHSLPQLANCDERVDAQFRKWAEKSVGDIDTGAVKAKELIQILLTAGVTPRDSLMSSWVYSLTGGSAQSAERVTELAQALGATNDSLRKRTTPGKTRTKLQEAFDARNEIAHELDVTDPEAGVRKPLEKIRRYRSETNVSEWCRELLDVTQLVTNDVAERLRPGDR